MTEADLIFRNQVRKRFAGGRFEGMYRAWKNGHISESHIRYEVGIDDRKYIVDCAPFYSRRMPKLILTRCHDDVNTNDANDRVVRRAWFDLPNELKWVSASTELSGRRHSYSRGRGATF